MYHVISGTKRLFVYDPTQPNKLMLKSPSDMEGLKKGGVIYDCKSVWEVDTDMDDDIDFEDDKERPYMTNPFFIGGCDEKQDASGVTQRITEDEYVELMHSDHFVFSEDEDLTGVLNRLYDKEIFDQTGIKVLVADGHILYLDCSQFKAGQVIRLSKYGTFYEAGSLRNVGYGEHTIVVDSKVECESKLVFSYQTCMDVDEDIEFLLYDATPNFTKAIQELQRLFEYNVLVQEI